MAEMLTLGSLATNDTLQGRVIGNRSIMAGTYHFTSASMVKHEITQIGDTGREIVNISVQSTEGAWIDLGSLLKRKKEDGALVYVNDWVCQYPTTRELALALVGNALVVGGTAVTTYTNWKNGEITTDLIPNGRTLPARLERPTTTATTTTASRRRRSS